MQIFSFQMLDSTQNKAKGLIEYFNTNALNNLAFCVVADEQTAGRGRLQRQWQSAFGNLHCSIAVFNATLSDGLLSLLSAICVKDAIGEYAEIKYKWPNDIMHNNAKICGIIIEKINNVHIIGVGLNVFYAPQVEGRKTTSLLQFNAVQQNADQILVVRQFATKICENLQHYLQLSEQVIISKWNQSALYVGQDINIQTGFNLKVNGIFLGVNSNAQAQIKLPSGKIKVIDFGEIS
jgi:BirA family biotin operon repressor/biotin-[acetyl-CoA-carboxylase] ligase